MASPAAIAALALALLTSSAAEAPVASLQPYLVGISVANAGRSAAWYETNLGFHEERRIELADRGLKIVFLRAGNFRLELIEQAGAAPLDRAAPAITDPMLVLGLKKIAFLVPDVEAAASALKTSGVRFVVQPFDDKPMRLRSFIVADPDGNLVQFMQEMP